MHVDVDPDQVDQRERADRPAGAEAHALVDVLGARRSLLEHAHRVVEHGDQDPVDDEAGRVAAGDGVLADLLRERVGRVERRVRGELAADDLDERQDRRGVEEVHPDDAVGPASTAAISVTESAEVFVASTVVRRDHGLDPREEVVLDREVLEDGLDHEVAAGERGDVVGGSSRPRCRSLSSSVSRPFSTLRASWRSTSPRPRSASSRVDSTATVGTPACTHSWAIRSPSCRARPRPPSAPFRCSRSPPRMLLRRRRSARSGRLTRAAPRRRRR